jgi:hypothetical protein
MDEVVDQDWFNDSPTIATHRKMQYQRKLKATWTAEAQHDFDAWCRWDVDSVIRKMQQEEDEKLIADLNGLIEEEPAKNEVLIQEED